MSNKCKTASLTYCSGAGETLNDDYFNCWRQVGCPTVFSNAIFTNPNGMREYTQAGLTNAQTYATTLLNSYYNLYKLTYPNSPGYNSFQVDLYNLCTDSINTPGLCQQYLASDTSICKTKTYDQMSVDYNFTNWCSCFTPPTEQSKSVYDSPTGAVITSCSPTPTSLDIGNVPCYPLCHQIGSIQLYQPETGCRYECNSDVCIISDVTINQKDATGNRGSVNFTQVCPGCTTENECVCIISSSDLQDNMNGLGIKSSFSQYCGYNANCYLIDSTGNLQSVPCNTFAGYGGADVFKAVIPWIFIGVAVFAIVLTIALILATRNKSDSGLPFKDKQMNNVEIDDG